MAVMVNTTGSSSVIVTLAAVVAPRVAPAGPLKVAVNVSLPSESVSGSAWTGNANLRAAEEVPSNVSGLLPAV